METIHIIVSGRVQGVYFRAFTKKQANKLNLVGFVKNKDNGDVEIIARADSDNLQKFISWCHKGPLMAKVKQVIVNKHQSIENFTQFEVR